MITKKFNYKEYICEYCGWMSTDKKTMRGHEKMCNAWVDSQKKLADEWRARVKLATVSSATAGDQHNMPQYISFTFESDINKNTGCTDKFTWEVVYELTELYQIPGKLDYLKEGKE